MVQGSILMARSKRKAEPDRPVASAEERVVIVHLKGSPEFAKWLDEVNNATGIPKTTIFRRAVTEWAAKHGHPAPPEI